MAKECECSIEHSVGKLGHSKACPYYKDNQLTAVITDMCTTDSCPPKHLDGTPHDFSWATYSDDHQSFGVCRCGYDSMSESLMMLP